jgi:photosystem II stability/assembly factor-like uncharacterized protein
MTRLHNIVRLIGDRRGCRSARPAFLNTEFLFVAILCLVSALGFVQAQTQVRGLYGGTVYSIVAGADRFLLVGTDRGVYSSKDGGATWSHGKLSGSHDSVITVGMDKKGELFAATAGVKKGLYRSVDKGNRWEILPSGLHAGQIVCLTPQTDGALFAGTADGTILRLQNGKLRSYLPNGLPRSIAVQAIAVDENGTIIAGTGGRGLYRASSPAGPWTPCVQPAPTTDIRSLVITRRHHWFAGTYGNGLLRSTDDGRTWIRIAGDQPAGIYFSLAVDTSDNLIAGTSVFGISRSSDDGKSWTQFGFLRKHILSVAIEPSQKILAGIEFGLFRFNDDEKQWDPIGVPGSTVSILQRSPSGTLVAGTREDGIFTSADSGRLWVRNGAGLTNLTVTSLAVENDTIFYAGIAPKKPQKTLGGFHVSYDAGQNWKQISLVDTLISSLVVDEGGTVVAATPYGVYRSTNKGKIWIRQSAGLGNAKVSLLAADAHGNMFAGASSGLFSSRRGTHWIKTGCPAVPVTSLLVDGEAKNLIGISIAKWYRSADHGNSWNRMEPDSVFGPLASASPDGESVITTGGRNMLYSISLGERSRRIISDRLPWERLCLVWGGLKNVILVAAEGAGLYRYSAGDGGESGAALGRRQ